MEIWRWWKKKCSPFSPKPISGRLASCFLHQGRGKEHGLVKLYEDVESCRGYRDIEIMWEMIQYSSGTSTVSNNRRSWLSRKFVLGQLRVFKRRSSA